ncbi:peptide chain release factor H [Actinoplanes sp. TBRC 11911]|uniref:peptide chain release factor H n=1 Tax=Actinoplanes sp. TBRC 11911 TaxID=2729386 RepID=UPI00145D7965|nr:peptide chain release factor H [Actinoplanes sp. TBRC 11911]NMO57900.1 peptide chain release factor H [Actinoplanes sp. TBRC 11911]
MTVHLLLSAGRGPEECAWAVAELTSRLEAEATKAKIRTERLETVAGTRRGTFRSVLLRLTGDHATEFAATWTGTLCWQAASPYRTGHGRKNWYVTAQPTDPGSHRTPFAESDVDVVAIRTGGPGGQHRNKASTAARATHRPSGIVVVADTEREFTLNRRNAIRMLRARLARADEQTARAAVTARSRLHDALVRGNPTRVVSAPGREG